MTKERINVADYVQDVGTDRIDQSDAFNAAADEARAQGVGLYMPWGVKLYINKHVNLRYIRDLHIRGDIEVGPFGMVIVGDTSTFRSGSHINLHRIIHVNRAQQTNPCVRIIGMKGAQIWLDHCDLVEWYADSTTPEDQSCSYNVCHFGLIRKMHFVCRDGVGPFPPGAETFGWITEMTFIGGEFGEIRTDSQSYEMNEITFIKPCIQVGQVHLDRAARWRFLGVRAEYQTPFYLGPNTTRILIEDNHVSNYGKTEPSAILVTDEGVDNMLVTSWDSHQARVVLWGLDETTTVLDASADVPVSNVSKGLDGAYSITQGAVCFDSGKLPLTGGSEKMTIDPASGQSMVRINVRCDQNAVIPRFYFYDINGALIEDEEAGFAWYNARWDAAGKFWTMDRAVSVANGVARTREVAFMRVELVGHTNPVPFRRLHVIGIMGGGSSDYIARLAQRRFTAHVGQDTPPLVGAQDRSDVVPKRTSGTWRVNEMRETTLAAESFVGSSTIKLSSVAGTAVGDVIGIRQATGVTHWTTIKSFSGATVTLDQSHPRYSPAGSLVKTTRWRASE